MPSLNGEDENIALLLMISILITNPILYLCRIVPAIAPSPAKPLPQRCNECLKYMDDPELKMFPGDPDTAVSWDVFLLSHE